MTGRRVLAHVDRLSAWKTQEHSDIARLAATARDLRSIWVALGRSGNRRAQRHVDEALGQVRSDRASREKRAAALEATIQRFLRVDSGPLERRRRLGGRTRSGKGTANLFVQRALAMTGKRYVYGAEVDLDNPHPSKFDCSELVQWAVHQAGGAIPDWSQAQRAWCKEKGRQISIEEALRTPGALLFNSHHVAISLGNGRTIEAKGRKYGVGSWPAGRRFTDAALVPGLAYG